MISLFEQNGQNQANTMKKLIPPTCRHDSSNIQRHGQRQGWLQGAVQRRPGEDTEEEFPLVLEDAEQPKEGKPGTSKSKGKQLGDQPAQAAEGAEAPPEETPPDPNSTKPHTDPAPIDPQPGTSKAPTQAPTRDPTQAPTKDPTRPPSKP